MRLRDAKRGGNLSDEHKAELAAMSFKELGELEEVRLERDPMEPERPQYALREAPYALRGRRRNLMRRKDDRANLG